MYEPHPALTEYRSRPKGVLGWLMDRFLGVDDRSAAETLDAYQNATPVGFPKEADAASEPATPDREESAAMPLRSPL